MKKEAYAAERGEENSNEEMLYKGGDRGRSVNIAGPETKL